MFLAAAATRPEVKSTSLYKFLCVRQRKGALLWRNLEYGDSPTMTDAAVIIPSHRKVVNEPEHSGNKRNNPTHKNVGVTVSLLFAAILTKCGAHATIKI